MMTREEGMAALVAVGVPVRSVDDIPEYLLDEDVSLECYKCGEESPSILLHIVHSMATHPIPHEVRS